MSRKTVLVANDTPSLRAAMRIALEHAGFQVIEAENGRATLLAVQRHFPDLVLLDLHMPDLDGWQTAQALWRDYRTASIPVIATTAADEVDGAELERPGFCSCLLTPFTVGRFLDEVRRCLGVGDPPGRNGSHARCGQIPRRAA